MYEPASHALLNEILDDIADARDGAGRRRFLTRLGANFYAIHDLFVRLYGERDDFRASLRGLVETLCRADAARSAGLRALDERRERDRDWFLGPQWVAMALYVGGFAGDLGGLAERLDYLEELGVNMLHLMPLARSPAGASDGGYAVSDYRAVDPRFGDVEQLTQLATTLREREMLLVLDVVLNHTADDHAWARAAQAGDPRYQAYYHVFDDRELPDRYEETMPEVFPDTAPGNFTWNEPMQKWVMTVFNRNQWDLDYANPAVLLEMLDVVLFWANRGADILRLDAVAFLWKTLGTTCQNQREAHLVLQLLKDCCQVAAPGVLFIAEAIVAPVEITKYFGEDAVVARECDIAYNATFMALLWDAVATRNARLLNQGIHSLPAKLEGSTWLNYVRCHDDIGLGFDDVDVQAAGYEPAAHRRFLLDYFTGVYPDTPARGQPFGRNDKTGDARISGSLASLAGLESALDSGEAERVDEALRLILGLHALILSFGGIPLLYYGDELGTLNDRSFLDDVDKARDSRWIHRPHLDWQRAERRAQAGSVEQQLFDGFRRRIAVRKATAAFGDGGGRVIVPCDDEHLFAYVRTAPADEGPPVLVVANFAEETRHVSLREIDDTDAPGHWNETLRDLIADERVVPEDGRMPLPGRSVRWLMADDGA